MHQKIEVFEAGPNCPFYKHTEVQWLSLSLINNVFCLGLVNHAITRNLSSLVQYHPQCLCSSDELLIVYVTIFTTIFINGFLENSSTSSSSRSLPILRHLGFGQLLHKSYFSMKSFLVMKFSLEEKHVFFTSLCN